LKLLATATAAAEEHLLQYHHSTPSFSFPAAVHFSTSRMVNPVFLLVLAGQTHEQRINDLQDYFLHFYYIFSLSLFLS